MNINAPVKPPPKPGQVKVYKAMYDYQAQNPDELSFKEGDVLYVIDMHSDWWRANTNGKTGLIPSNYGEFNLLSKNM